MIRLAVAADVPAMARLINAAFSIEEFLEGNRTSESALTEMIREGSFLLQHNEDGTLLASVYIEERGERAYFGMLAVDPAQQGRGFGREMVRSAEDYCRNQGCTAMDIYVLSLRPELPAFYRKLGYVESGVEEFLPSRPLKNGLECHTIIMSREL